MPVATKIQQFIENASWIREMFEAGNRLREEVGPENVFDFSLGNPDLAPLSSRLLSRNWPLILPGTGFGKPG